MAGPIGQQRCAPPSFLSFLPFYAQASGSTLESTAHAAALARSVVLCVTLK